MPTPLASEGMLAEQPKEKVTELAEADKAKLEANRARFEKIAVATKGRMRSVSRNARSTPRVVKDEPLKDTSGKVRSASPRIMKNLLALSAVPVNTEPKPKGPLTDTEPRTAHEFDQYTMYYISYCILHFT